MKTFSLFIITSLIGINLFSQTYFQGGIYNNTEWTKLNSPYIITGDVVLFPDKTLTIQPGVEIRFDGFYFLEIRGTLISIGTETDRISYKSNASTRNKSDWDKLKLKTNQGAKASFEYCDFSDAETANEVDCCWGGGPIYFKNCKFENNVYAMTGYTGYEIEVDNCEFTNNTYCVSHADKKISNSSFIGNEYGLFYTERIDVYNSVFYDNSIAINGSRGTIDGCMIENNGIGILEEFDGFKLTNNMIQNNDTGIMVTSNYGYYQPITDNHICNNGLNAINMDDVNKDLTGNCWCTSDSTEIENKLIDGYDNIYLGLFNYDIYEDNCVTIVKSVIKVNLTSITEFKANQLIEFYPNPFQEYLTVNFITPPVNPVICSIFNNFGKKVFTKTFNEQSMNLELSHLPSGIYALRIKTGDSITNTKIIKM
jgi:hypothetical protein